MFALQHEPDIEPATALKGWFKETLETLDKTSAVPEQN
jgi:hypothetical protein